MSEESHTSVEDSVRMLVLETDQGDSQTQENRGTFAQRFDEVFKNAGDAHDPPLGIHTIMRFIVEEEGGKVPTMDEIDEMGIHCILITGSMYDANGDNEWISKLVKLLQGSFLQHNNRHTSAYD